MTDVAAWRAADPDPVTRAALADATQLEEPLQFGTAGLRGAIGAGPGKMNRLVVRRATAGLVATLGAGARLIIGHDARHQSDRFAADAAAIASARGAQPTLLDSVVPTPVVAHAVRAGDYDAGIMVTASHNPPADNGYKVYLRGGAQVLPVDADRIEEAIAAVPLVAEHLDEVAAVPAAPFVEAYLDAVAPPRALHQLPRVVYTPMHGVGGEVMAEALRRRGVEPVVVAAQALPDPDFPTVAFPNPEEPGALDLALELAAEVAADLVLANDPDADRLAVAVPDGETYRVLRGDELGALLGDWLLRAGDLAATTIVSSSLLGKIATARGASCRETLTGFKWLMAGDDELAFAYEEALGYAVSPAVRDKDGISAALAVLDLWATHGDLLAKLDAISATYGLHLNAQVSIRVDGDDPQAELAQLMHRLRSSPPAQLGGHPVMSVTDLLVDATTPPADVLRFDLDSARVLIRPSGTEPKLKAYLEVVGSSEDAAAAEAALEALDRDVRALLRT